MRATKRPALKLAISQALRARTGDLTGPGPLSSTRPDRFSTPAKLPRSALRAHRAALAPPAGAPWEATTCSPRLSSRRGRGPQTRSRAPYRIGTREIADPSHVSSAARNRRILGFAALRTVALGNVCHECALHFRLLKASLRFVGQPHSPGLLLPLLSCPEARREAECPAKRRP